ncbi:hypothetical protein APHAL10511_004801 [Amanita phalloides]|nr:hypothetical protein APHAL10511_004801 [Amanita phalloides]
MSSGDVVMKLADLLAQPLVSLEIIPGGLDDWLAQGARPEFPFLLTEGNLGVPRNVLYALYLVAVAMFANRQQHQGVIASTSVILLANPAHQTALNARKRLILRGELLAEQELRFTELLLRGSEECAKQSILWDHRRWIFLRLYGAAVPPEWSGMENGWLGPLEWDNIPRMPVTVARKELNLMKRTCEIYPRNYYGWNHWRYIANVIFVGHQESGEWKQLMTDVRGELMDWVQGHVSDYTAMHHLHGLCERFGQDKGALMRQARELLTYYGAHEAVRCYGRLVGVDTRDQE